MSMLNRFRRLIVADAHGVIDALEDKPLLLKQCLRDAESALAEKRGRLAAEEAQVATLKSRVERLDADLAACDADVELALAEEEEALARFAVGRLLPLRRERAAVSARLEAAEAAVEDLRGVVKGQSAELEALSLRVRDRLADLERDAVCQAAPSAAEEIDLELLRRRAGEGA